MRMERRGGANSKGPWPTNRRSQRVSASATPPRKGSHEPDDLRGSSPESVKSVGGWRCNSSGLPGTRRPEF